MSTNLLDSILDGPFALTRRPEPVSGDLRIGWGIAIIVLILGKCRGKRASLQKLHFLAHSIRTCKARTDTLKVFARTLRSSDIIIRVEPWLNRALAFANGSGLIELEKGNSAKLSSAGLRVLATLYEDEGLFTEEKRFLDTIGTQATEETIRKIMGMEVSL